MHFTLSRRFQGTHHNTACLAAAPIARMSTGVRASLVDKVKEMAQKHKVVVFAKSYCPYCMQVGLCRLLMLYILLPVCSMAPCLAMPLDTLLPAARQAWPQGLLAAAAAAAAGSHLLPSVCSMALCAAQ